MDGKDILKYFNGRTASKMLLGEAIDRNLLSTFQYFGITDDVDYRKLKWTRGKYLILRSLRLRSMRYLTCGVAWC